MIGGISSRFGKVAFSVLFMLFSSCRKDSDPAGNNRSPLPSPRYEEIIDPLWKNTNDEKTLKLKAKDAKSLLDSTKGLRLIEVKPPASPKRKATLSSQGLFDGLVDFMATESAPLDVKATIKSALFYKLDVDDDCTSLVNELGTYYDRMSVTMRLVLEKLEKSNLAEVKGLKKTEAVEGREAFAYQINVTKDLLEPQVTKEVPEEVEEAAVSGRFSGGANDHSLALFLNTDLTASGTGELKGLLKASSRSQALVELSKKRFVFSTGITGVLEEGSRSLESGSVSGNLKFEIVGGDFPGIHLEMLGTGTTQKDGKITKQNGAMRFAMELQTKNRALMKISGKTNEGEFENHLHMKIDESGKCVVYVPDTGS